MTHTNTFSRDLARGQKVERIVLDIVKAKYPDAYLMEGYCKEWDIFIPSEDKGVEVKYDPMSQKTGNIVIEIEYNKKPSALSTTKSYRWVIHTGKEMIITTPDRIRKAIDDNNLRTVKFTGPGDPHSKLAYLVKKHMLEDTAITTRTHSI